MPLTAYPSSSDLSTYLTAAGFTGALAAALDLTNAAAGGAAAFEREAGRIMLAQASETRRYDPPTYGELLQIEDLTVFTTLQYQPQGATAETWTENVDFTLEPYNRTNPTLPVERVRFYRRWLSPLDLPLRRSLLLTGQFGYAASIPADAWRAMLAGAALDLFPQLTQAVTGGLLSWKEADVEESYGVETWTRLKDAWGGQFRAAVRRYQRVWL